MTELRSNAVAFPTALATAVGLGFGFGFGFIIAGSVLLTATAGLPEAVAS